MWLIHVLTSCSSLTVNLGVSRIQSTRRTPTCLEHSSRVAFCDLPWGRAQSPLRINWSEAANSTARRRSVSSHTCGELRESLWRVAALPDKEKDQLVKTRKVVEKGLAWARPLYVAHRHLKGDIGLKWDPNFGERNLLSVVFWIEIFLFHLIYLTVCVCECRYFVNLLLNISKKNVHKFDLSLNSLGVVDFELLL